MKAASGGREPRGPLRVLFLTGNFGVGGKERQLAEIIRNLPAERFSTYLWVKSQQAYYLERIRGRLSGFHSRQHAHFLPTDFWSLYRTVIRIRPDVIWSWATTTSHFCLPLWLLLKRRFALIEGSIRSAPTRLTISERLHRLLYCFYPLQVANSHAGLEAYGQAGRRGRYVLHNGLDFARVPQAGRLELRRQLGWNAGDFIITMVGSLIGQKDHRTFIASMPAVLAHCPSARFFLVGEGGLRDEHENDVRRRGLGKRVHFLGRRRDVEHLLRASDLSVLTSTVRLGEGISNALLESMACGTPVIASDCKGTREVIVDGCSGFIIPGGDARALAERILLLYRRPDLRMKAARAAESRIRSKFSIERMMNDCIGLLEHPPHGAIQ